MSAIDARRREPLAAQRGVTAFKLRAERGLPFEEIGERLGISRSAAWKAYQRQLVAVRESVNQEDRLTHMCAQLTRLDAALRITMDILEDGNLPAATRLAAVDRIVRVEERRARLLGLDAQDRAMLPEPPHSEPVQLTDEEAAAEIESWERMMITAVQVRRGPEAIMPPPNA